MATSKDCQDFAKVFLTSMLAMTHDMLNQKWDKEAAHTLRAMVRNLGQEKARVFGMPWEAGIALAEYALLTIQVNGMTLAERERREAEASELEARARALRGF